MGVSPKELIWLLTEPDIGKTDAAKFWDIPDVRTWLQQDFHVENPDSILRHKGALAMVMRFLMTFVPVMRIITILALTMILIATYCDDFNPIDKYVREKFNATCTYCPDYDRN